MKDKIKEWLKNDHYQVFNAFVSVVLGSIIGAALIYLWLLNGC